MTTNATHSPAIKDNFDLSDKNLWVNVVVFIAIFVSAGVSFLIFRGMRKSSKDSNDIYAGDYSDDENEEEGMQQSLLTSSIDYDADSVGTEQEVAYVPPNMISLELEDG